MRDDFLKFLSVIATDRHQNGACQFLFFIYTVQKDIVMPNDNTSNPAIVFINNDTTK